MKLPALALAALALAGCALYRVDVNHVTGAPTAVPAARTMAREVPKAPTGATRLASIEAVGNAYASQVGCRARLLEEATAIGATAVVFLVTDGGGPFGLDEDCKADVYIEKAP